MRWCKAFLIVGLLAAGIGCDSDSGKGGAKTPPSLIATPKDPPVQPGLPIPPK